MPQINLKYRKATNKQQEYIEQLCIDIHCSERTRRNAVIGDILGRPIKYLDEIHFDEVNNLLSKLKQYKADQ